MSSRLEPLHQHIAIGKLQHAKCQHGPRQERHQRRNEELHRIHRKSVIERKECQGRYERCGNHWYRYRQHRTILIHELERADDGTKQARGGDIDQRRAEDHRQAGRERGVSDNHA